MINKKIKINIIIFLTSFIYIIYMIIKYKERYVCEMHLSCVWGVGLHLSMLSICHVTEMHAHPPSASSFRSMLKLERR